MALDEKETLELVRLLGKLEEPLDQRVLEALMRNVASVPMLVRVLRMLEWPLHPLVFGALMQVTVSVPIELCVLDAEERVLTFYRRDEYDGHHMPGTVLRNNETVRQAVKRLIRTEVVGGTVTHLKNIGWVEISKGDGRGKNPTRHEISLLFLCRLQGKYRGKGGIFSPLNRLPKDMLGHHRVLVSKSRKYLGTCDPILGK